MSYSSDGDPRVTRVMAAIDELIDALEATGDPMFGHKVNTAPIRWLDEALNPLGYCVRTHKVIEEPIK